MTERLYYADSYCTRFVARVIERLDWDGHPAVVLDRTAFYPTSGGQPADRGTLDGVAVTNVVVREEDQAVVHVLASVLSETDEDVSGEVDWARRFDHMQQHTGQHVLSAAFEQLLDADTVGFHLGAEACTIDVNLARLDPGEMRAVETLANQVVWEDRPVRISLVDAGQVSALPLRRPPTVEGPVRIVEIAARPAVPNLEPSSGSPRGFDVNPCGGTHVARTGEIGLIRIVRLDYRGEETRIEFLCGARALRDYRAKDAVVAQLAGRLTVGYWELDEAVERLQEEFKHLRRDLRNARQQLLEVKAAELAETCLARGAYRMVQHVWAKMGVSPGELRVLAQQLVQRFGLVVFLGAVDERAQMCFACPEGMDLDVAALLRETCARLGGKGGGRPHFAQGSAPEADPARVEAAMADVVLEFLPETGSGEGASIDL